MKKLIIVLSLVGTFSTSASANDPQEVYRNCATKTSRELLTIVKNTVGLQSLNQLAAASKGIEIACSEEAKAIHPNIIGFVNPTITLQVAYELFPNDLVDNLK